MASKEQNSEPAGKLKPSFLEAKEIKRLIGILSAAGGLELELEDAGMRLRIRMPEPQGRTEYVQVPGPYSPFVGQGAPQSPPLAESETEAAPGALPEGAVHINSPMVGTFYRAASPESEPFVNVGDHVTPESTVCILEAMKVMNEIHAEVSGEVLQILVENGEPVEFGQPLFVVRRS